MVARREPARSRRRVRLVRCKPGVLARLTRCPEGALPHSQQLSRRRQYVRKALLIAMAFAAVPTGLAVAQSDGLKVTGGGQVVASGQTTGPGDTIAFNAQQIDPAGSAAKGQLQVIDRTNSEKF